MNTYLLVKYLHYVGIFSVVGGLFMELVLVRKEMSRKELARLWNIDGVYGIGSVFVLAIGFLLWFGVGKPAEFYSTNWIFHSKVGIFAIIGTLSIWPSRFFYKNRRKKLTEENQSEIIQVPVHILNIIKIEIGLLCLIPLLAVLMASGIGQIKG